MQTEKLKKNLVIVLSHVARVLAKVIFTVPDRFEVETVSTKN